MSKKAVFFLNITAESIRKAIVELKEAKQALERTYDIIPDQDYLKYIDQIDTMIKQLKKLWDDTRYEAEIL